MIDPYSMLQGTSRSAPRIQRQRTGIPPLPPEEEQSLLGRLGSGALEGLAYVGSSLDKALGGRAIRGLLGGRPEELLSIIPFSDSMGITDHENMVSGAELLGNKDADLLSPEGIAGLGAEVLLDPAMYLSFGGSALTKLGKAAKKAGVLPKTKAGQLSGLGSEAAARALGGMENVVGPLNPSVVKQVTDPAIESLARVSGGLQDFVGPLPQSALDDVAGKRLGGHVGFGLPFMDNLATFDMTGVGGKIDSALRKVPLGPGALYGMAATGLSKAGNFLDEKVTGPLFRAKYGSQDDRAMQELYETMIHNRRPEYQAAARGATRELVEEADALGTLTPQTGSQLRDYLENAFYGPMPQNAEKQLDSMRAVLDENLLAKQKAGLADAYELTDQTIYSGPGAGNKMGYAPRQVTDLGQPLEEKRQKLFAPGQEKARDTMFQGLPASRVNTLVADDMSKMPTLAKEDYIRKEYLGLPDTWLGDLNNLKATKDSMDLAKKQIDSKLLHPTDPAYATAKALADQLPGVQKQIESIEIRAIQAKSLANWKEAIGTSQVPFFGNHPIQDIMTKVMKDQDRILKAEALHEGIARFANEQADGPLLTTFLQLNNLAPPGTPATDALLRKLPGAQNALRIPKEVAEPLSNFMQVYNTPAGLKSIKDAYDSVTDLTKAYQTIWRPAHHVRNQMTAVFQHAIHGAKDPTAPLGMQLIKPWRDADALHKTGLLPDANKIPGLSSLDNIAASKALEREMIDLDVVHRGGRSSAEVMSDPAKMGQTRIEDLLPGKSRPGVLASAAQGFKEGSWSPLSAASVTGVGKNTTDKFAPILAGRNVQLTLDDINRKAAYIAYRRQGYVPKQAAEMVKAVHYDFGNLSQFERTFMRRLIPFYGWMRQNIPSVLTELAQNPGGKMRQAIRGTEALRGDEPGFIPGYIGHGVAAKVGEPQEGTTRFLSRLGLPFEDLGEMLSGGGPLGGLNPIIKAPVEQMTGSQLYSGRDLRDLYSMTGAVTGQALQPLENYAMNSPLGPLMNFGRTLTDPRKDWGTVGANLLTGLKFTDVDMDKARDIRTNEIIEDVLRGQPGVGRFERLYVKPENLAQLSPAEQDLYRLYVTREAARRRRAGG